MRPLIWFGIVVEAAFLGGLFLWPVGRELAWLRRLLLGPPVHWDVVWNLVLLAFTSAWLGLLCYFFLKSKGESFEVVIEGRKDNHGS